LASTHVAPIRGIAVGGTKRVAMSELRELVASLGYGDVRTVLNSGNVVFRARDAARSDPAARIERALASRLGLCARVVVLTARELRDVVEANPLSVVATHPSRLLVAVPARASDRVRVSRLTRQDWSPETIGLGPRAAYLWCADGIARSPLAEAVGRALGDAATSRSWATITKLYDLLPRA
jgi:uncharacterized protein (DUF1697 family)